jgi:hypothetical protein
MRHCSAARGKGGTAVQVRRDDPSGLKPDLFTTTYVRAAGRTLRNQSFSAACKAEFFAKHYVRPEGRTLQNNEYPADSEVVPWYKASER